MLTATGTGPGDCLRLGVVHEFRVFQVGTTPPGSGIGLPPLLAYRSAFVIENRGANPVNIFPAPSAHFEGWAPDVPYVLPAGMWAGFVAASPPAPELRASYAGWSVAIPTSSQPVGP
jgi:hypothetical protein